MLRVNLQLLVVWFSLKPSRIIVLLTVLSLPSRCFKSGPLLADIANEFFITREEGINAKARLYKPRNQNRGKDISAYLG
jgi:hypothetical protein